MRSSKESGCHINHLVCWQWLLLLLRAPHHAVDAAADAQLQQQRREEAALINPHLVQAYARTTSCTWCPPVAGPRPTPASSRW